MTSNTTNRTLPNTGTNCPTNTALGESVHNAANAVEFGPHGVDNLHWVFASLLQDCISHFDAKELHGKTLLLDDEPSLDRLRECWLKVQSRKKSEYPQVATLFSVPDITVAQFNQHIERYRACRNHPLALVPLDQWRKPISNWDDHVYAVTVTQGIALPHPSARRSQDSIAFAAAFMARAQSPSGAKPSESYRNYKAAVVLENANRHTRKLLPLRTFERRLVDRLLAWFPHLPDAALNWIDPPRAEMGVQV